MPPHGPFDGGAGLWGDLHIAFRRQVVVGRALVPQGLPGHQKDVFLQLRQHAAGPGADDLLYAVGDEPVQNLRGGGRPHRSLDQTDRLSVHVQSVDRVHFCGGDKAGKDRRTAGPGIAVHRVPQKREHRLVREPDPQMLMVRHDDGQRVAVVFQKRDVVFYDAHAVSSFLPAASHAPNSRS